MDDHSMNDPATYEDILYEERDGAAWITINRPKVYNAFRAKTCDELTHALRRAGWNKEIGVIVLGGAGDKAFCTGGDQSEHDGAYEGSGTIGLPIEDVHSAMRDVPVPVIARVQGYSIGGGNVLATLCDFTIASESAIFGQVGPKVGSVDPGWGTAYLARVIGEKKAREMWYLCRQYTAQQALEMGLVNTVVPDEDLDAEIERWCAEIMERSPTAIAIAKRSFNADSESIRAVGSLGFEALALFYETEESKEGGNAFREKRKPEFRKKRGR
jgi:2-ketocyclohexanecarboxyl-CoA hydrolase